MTSDDSNMDEPGANGTPSEGLSDSGQAPTEAGASKKAVDPTITPAPSNSASGEKFTTQSFIPTTDSKWVTPGLAAYVVSAVAFGLLVIVVFAIFQLQVVGGDTAGPDPNAGTIAAIAGSGITALTSLTAAYFGIKVASEQSAQAALTTSHALQVLSMNSTTNGNATWDE